MSIELIDVLWLQSDAIIAAFDLEHTTAILLRAAPDIRSSEHSAKSGSPLQAGPEPATGFDRLSDPRPPRSRPCPWICLLRTCSQAAAGVQEEWELCSSLLHKSSCFIIASNCVLLDKIESQEERSPEEPASASDIQELSSLHISPLPAKCILDPHCSILHKILKSVFSDS